MKILLLYLLLLCALHLPAQQKEFIFKNFTQEEGLPSNEAYFIFEDSKHYIWIATDLGVVRYNGNKFQQFNLPDNVVFKIREDSKGRIWFFSHKGLLAYFQHEKLYAYKYNNIIAERIGKIHIKDAFVDDKDNIWLSSILDSNFYISANGKIRAESYENSGPVKSHMNIEQMGRNIYVTRIQERTFYEADSIIIDLHKENKHLLYQVPMVHRPFSHFETIAADGEDMYFFAGKFLFRLNANGSYIVKKMPEPILCIRYFNQNVYVGMIKKGMAILKNDLSEPVHNLALTTKSVTSIQQDYEGGLWLSTLESGVYYARNTNIRRLSDDGTTTSFVSRTLNVNDSILLYSTENGLYKIAHDTSELFLKIKNTGVNGLLNNKKGILYYSGGFDSFDLVRIKDPYFKIVEIMTVPSQPVLLSNDTVVTSKASAVHIFKSTLKASNRRSAYDTGYFIRTKTVLSKPAKLFADADQTLWAATNDGLYRSAGNYDTLIRFMPSNTLLSEGISNIKQMANGIMVAGIRFSGVVLIKDNRVIAHIAEKDGLLSNKIRFLLPLNNHLWVATAKGISVVQFTSFDPVTYTITNISKDDGFYNITINQLELYKTDIVAATSNGLYFIENPGFFLHKKFPPVAFYINTVSYYNGDTTGISSISLPYSKKRLVIKYTAVSFSSYETVQYLYRFKQSDTTWRRTPNTELLLENLESGEYQLQLKAFIPNQNRYSAIQSLTITIEKPWWQNNWFRLFCLLVIALVVYLFVARRIKKIQTEEKRKTELNNKLTELEQTALRSQMNPHFIFNCLTSIQQLIISGNKTDANEYLVKFSRLIRKTLEMSARPFISISEEKTYLEEYLFLEQLRLAGKFEYSITADASIDTEYTLIPNMMIQPVVENCVRHGVKSLENRQGIITVKFEPGENAITCTITDNGVGRSNTSSSIEKALTKHKSYGMDIVRKRLETFSEFNVDKSGIEINDLYDADGIACGTEVILHLPLKKQAAL